LAYDLGATDDLLDEIDEDQELYADSAYTGKTKKKQLQNIK